MFSFCVVVSLPNDLSIQRTRIRIVCPYFSPRQIRILEGSQIKVQSVNMLVELTIVLSPSQCEMPLLASRHASDINPSCSPD